MQDKRQHGFTLVEILFVVVLVSLLSVSILSVITRLEGTKRSAEDRRETTESVTYITGLIRTLLYSKSGTPLPVNTNSSQSTTGQSISPGAQRSIIVEKSGQSSSGETLRFSTFLPVNFLPEITKLSGDVEARFYVNKDKLLIFEAWDIAQNTQGLNSNSSPKAALVSLPVAKGIEQIKFRYWANNQWSEDWNSPYLNNPKLIEASFLIISNDGSKNFIRVAIPYSRT